MMQERFSPAGRPRPTAAIAAIAEPKMIAPKKPDLMFWIVELGGEKGTLFLRGQELVHIGSDGSRESLDEE